MTPATEARRVRDLFINSIRALAEALEAKDPYTAGHSRRVTEISVAIAGEMDMDKAGLAQVRLAAMLHDIGKIGVRESVLNKEGSLTPEEYEHIMQHMSIGRRILAPIFTGKSILDIVTYHHERWDGTGLPQGLKGRHIPLGARIVGLADAVDAMGSMRPYRPGRAPQEIASEIEKNAGRQFDSEVVKAFFATKYGRMLTEACLDAQEHDTATSTGGSPVLDSQQDNAPEEPAAVSAGPAAAEGEPEALTADAPPASPVFGRARIFKDAREINDVKALPFVTAEVLSLTSAVNSDIDALISTILKDQALVAKILKLANTSFYASRGRVQTVDRAVVNIGFSGIREIALGVAVVEVFRSNESSGSFDRLALWRHQLATAALGRALAAAGECASPEDAFVAGLLHDTGISVLDDLYPEQYAVAAEYARTSGRPLVEAEKAYMGADHAEVAAQFASGWNLPEKLTAVMERHHEPWDTLSDDMSPGVTTLMVVKLAESMARAFRIGDDCDPLLEDVPLSVFRRLKLDEHNIAQVFKNFPTELAELEMVFFMNSEGDARFAVTTQPEQIVGRKALMVEASKKPFDPVEQFLKSLDMEVFSARSVQEGLAEGTPDVVILRHKTDKSVETALKQLTGLAEKGVVGAVKVFILGSYATNGRESIYPASCTAVLRPPFSIPNLTRNLELFFAD